MLQVGDIRIHLMNDATVAADGGGVFGVTPRALWKKYFTPDEDNIIPMNLHCLLVQVGGRNIVIDTGLGDKLSEKQRAIWRLNRPDGGLIGGLTRLGVTLGEIDMVVNTHLHADHASGNTMYDASGELVPVFPNAEYVVQLREYEDARRANERTRATYLPINYESLIASGQMKLVDGDTDFAPGMRGMITRGHTPGHMSIRFESENQHAAFLCDLAPYTVLFERIGWTCAYDVEPLHTIETKRIWQNWALETNAILFFVHDPKCPAAKLVRDGEGVRIEPVPISYA